MAMALFLITFAFFVALIIGLIRPGIVIRWGNNKTRKRVALIYGAGLIVFFIAFAISVPTQTEYNLITDPATGQVPLTVTFKASSNKSLKNIEEIKWNFGDGETGLGKEITHTYEKEGSYEVELNLVGNEETTNLTKNITANNSPPKAAITADKKSGYPPLKVEFDASQSRDIDDSIQEYRWDFGKETKSGQKVAYTFQQPGNYDVELTVTDDDSDSTTKTETIKVEKPVPKAIINASVTSGFKPLEIQFDASGSTSPKGEIKTYKWNLGDGSSERGTKVSHTYKQSGEFKVELTVITEDGFTGASSENISIRNKSPKPSLEVTSIDGLTVNLDLSNSNDPDGSIAKYKVWFGDGNVEEIEGRPGQISHTYEEPGVFKVQLEVTDDSGVNIRSHVRDVEVGNVISIDGEEQKCYPPQTKVYTDKFSFSVYEEPQYRESIGGMFGESAGEGAIFLLVPVKITNLTNESESLSLTTSWEVIDLDQGYTYEVATGADIYLDSSERLETNRIPPDLSRSGYIVFEINKSSRDKRLVLKKEAGILFQSSYYFAINFQ